MISFWWLIPAYAFGMWMGAEYYKSGYFHREYDGDADE